MSRRGVKHALRIPSPTSVILIRQYFGNRFYMPDSDHRQRQVRLGNQK